ncbi:DUF3574 domain-containing protein [Flavivirga eckloniae]|uniref:DUF3574 domain-containing protein n=1 Tax=Flavivirga eckloniae TaxID=1803846 RepID=A0A2K9PK03_9FLAO|nr:DUF3574 domain-containing protein [Flavivirga eckloniae]AUP77391.1 hypothetical protein C1H87_01105 [Flavivirga eckloniae]
MIRCITLFVIVIFVGIGVSCNSAKSNFNYVKTELYFGLSEGNVEITEDKWKDFKAKYFSVLPGYTEVDCNGFWTNPSNITVSEKCKLIIYINKGTKKDSTDIANLVNNYKRLFHQESVLKVQTHVKASF